MKKGSGPIETSPQGAALMRMPSFGQRQVRRLLRSWLPGGDHQAQGQLLQRIKGDPGEDA
jgi:hypothetical protein